ncbi:MAG: 2'-5' RNA ligase family protein, partial [bacterium]
MTTTIVRQSSTPTKMRLFIAISFPEPELRAIGDRMAMVKSKLPPASWVRPETQHLTFAFLGEQPESLLPALSTTVEASLSIVPRFQAHLRGSGFFPNPRHARVGWVGA